MTQVLHEWVSRQADVRPDAAAVVAPGECLTYGQLDAMSNQLARALKDAGCKKGDRVCLLMPGSRPRCIGRSTSRRTASSSRSIPRARRLVSRKSVTRASPVSSSPPRGSRLFWTSSSTSPGEVHPPRSDGSIPTDRRPRRQAPISRWPRSRAIPARGPRTATPGPTRRRSCSRRDRRAVPGASSSHTPT